MRMTETVKQLLIINIIFFIGSNIVGDLAYQLFSEYYPANPHFRFWQPLTAMFMHAPIYNSNPIMITHILFNMFALVSFGSPLEHYWGGKRFLFFYITCGLGAAALHTLFGYYQFHLGVEHLQQLGLQDQTSSFLNTAKLSNVPGTIDSEVLGNMYDAYNAPSLGASGAIYGLLTAFAFMFPLVELQIMFIPFPVKAKYFVPGLIAVDLFLGFKGNSIFGVGGTGIAHFAHVGGALTGFLMMWYWKRKMFKHNRWN